MCERPLTLQSYRTTSHHYDVMIDKWIGVCLRLRVERETTPSNKIRHHHHHHHHRRRRRRRRHPLYDFICIATIDRRQVTLL